MNKNQITRYVVVALAAFTLSIVGVRAQTNSPGTALYFNGTNQDVMVPHQGSLDAFPITVMCWFNTTNSNEGGLVNKYKAMSFNGYQIFIQGGHLYAWYIGGSTKTFTPNVNLDGGVVTDGNWHHAALSVDVSGGRLYLDGNLVNSETWGGTPIATTTTEPVYLGYYPGITSPGVSGYYAGDLDEVSIWNVALLQSQIQTYMNRSLAGTEPSLVAYYRLDEGSGTTTADVSGNGNAGALQGSPMWVPSGASVGIVPPTGYSNGWTQISANYASALTASADALTMIQPVSFDSPPGAYRSTNGGATWMPTTLPGGNWDRAAVSADGGIMYVSQSTGSNAIAVSTDSGVSWNLNTNLFLDRWCVACSADGSTIVVASQSANIAVSHDSGQTWSTNYFPGSVFHYTTCSADGTKMVAAGFGSPYYSTDSGANWSQGSIPAPNFYGSGLAASADGSKLIAIGDYYFGGDPVVISRDYGATWSIVPGLPSALWYGVASSADGSKLIACNYTNIYASTDFGNTWQDTVLPADAYAGSPVMSADGTRSYVGCYTTLAFTSLIPPVVQFAPTSPTNAMISWPNPSTGFNLQQSSDLVTWSNTPIRPSVVSSQNQTTVTNTGSAFYRLAFP